MYKNKLILFSLDLYAHSEIKEQCLFFQKYHNINVNILLWLCWLESESIFIPEDKISEFDRKITTLSLNTVDKLRLIRNALKESKDLYDDFNEIKSYILDAEIKIEKIFINKLQVLTVSYLECFKASQGGNVMINESSLKYIETYLKDKDVKDSFLQAERFRSYYKHSL